jgi:flagellar basal body-associated protein FliL
MGHKTETPKDDENKEFDIKGAIIVGVIAGVVLIGTGVTLAVVLTKKKAPAQEKEETKEETQK